MTNGKNNMAFVSKPGDEARLRHYHHDYTPGNCNAQFFWFKRKIIKDYNIRRRDKPSSSFLG